MNKIIPSVIEDNGEYYIHMEEYKTLKENYDRIYNENCKLREEHYITDISLLDENQQLKKQKDDVVEYAKHLIENKIWGNDGYINGKNEANEETGQDLLRMLGEIDDSN